MDSKTLVLQLRTAVGFFDRSTSWLTEDGAGFAPSDGMFTSCQHVAHVAQTIDWFMAGAFGSSWDMDFAGHDAKARSVTTLAEARA